MRECVIFDLPVRAAFRREGADTLRAKLKPHSILRAELDL
ncbi:hypothetical protein COO91_03633 [Nostoc flagelliforme CCNUN1]|uniref:Uncharacterized protein n=1 Tax=Nostoc flagelliforme CCNUN1 TaxID=2038116 RepID=A0A2K8SQH3_9NOSO|nr:hypothetical protein COO91_03633 [Nostoc flagelliforme CCNUN1]